jgi:hypothetical protein
MELEGSLIRTSRNQKGFKHNPQSAKGRRARTLCVLREGTQRKSLMNTYDENPCTKSKKFTCKILIGCYATSLSGGAQIPIDVGIFIYGRARLVRFAPLAAYDDLSRENIHEIQKFKPNAPPKISKRLYNRSNLMRLKHRSPSLNSLKPFSVSTCLS